MYIAMEPPKVLFTEVMKLLRMATSASQPGLYPMRQSPEAKVDALNKPAITPPNVLISASELIQECVHSRQFHSAASFTH